LVNGNNSGATGVVTVATVATLGGTGTIGGGTIINGTLAPGNSIGTLTFNSNLTFGATGTGLFEISKVPFTNDAVRVLSSVSYNGTLTVIHVNPADLLQTGDNYRLFDATNYSGSFSDFNLPSLDEGLDWNTSKLAVNGRLWVVTTNPPVLANAHTSGGNFIFNGNGGTPGWDYYMLTSTNLTLPVGNWTRLTTNVFDGSGNFSFTNAINANASQTFYRLQVP
jgi:fibronectin-binding autotransporter adhesin